MTNALFQPTDDRPPAEVDPTGPGARGLYLLALLATLAVTLSFIQAFRGILQNPKGLDPLVPWIVGGILCALLTPLLAGLIRASFLVFAGAALAGIGRILLLLPQPDPVVLWDGGPTLGAHFAYGLGMFLCIGGFCVFFTALVGGAGRFAQQQYSKKVYAGAVASGLCLAFGWQMALRYAGIAWDVAPGISAGLFSVFLGVAWYWTTGGGVLVDQHETRNASFAPGDLLAAFGAGGLLGLQLMLLLLCVGRPEYAAHNSGLPYEYTSLAVTGALLLAGLLAYYQMRRRDEFRGLLTNLLPALNLIPALTFAIQIPGYVFSADTLDLRGPPLLILFAVSTLVVGLNTAYLLRVITVGRSAWAMGAVGGGMFFALLFSMLIWIAPDDIPFFDMQGWFGVAVYQPWFFGAVSGVFVLGMLMIIRPMLGLHTPTIVHDTPIMILPLLVLVALPAGFLGYRAGEDNLAEGGRAPLLEPENQHLVLACLYTWYGTPDGALGERLWKDKDIIGEKLQAWQARADTKDGKSAFTLVKDAFAGAAGKAQATASAAGEELVVEHPFDTGALWHPWDEHDTARKPRGSQGQGHGRRVTLTVRAAFSGGAGFIRFSKGNMLYEARLTPGKDVHTLVFPDDFTARDQRGNGRVALAVRAAKPGALRIDPGPITARGWSHYNENFHIKWREKEGAWANVPPKTQGTENHPYFNPADSGFEKELAGLPTLSRHPDAVKLLREAEPYSLNGYYDSLDDNVIRSQLRLMEAAGVDVCLIMHPRDMEVVERIYRLAKEISSTLRFTFYGNPMAVRREFPAGDNPGEPWRLVEKRGEKNLYERDQCRDFVSRFGSDERTLKVGERVVYFTSPTGQSQFPYRHYHDRFEAIRKSREDGGTHGVFLVGDNYAPAPEEWMQLFDGTYYYDTSGIWRAGWGDSRFPVTWIDGKKKIGGRPDGGLMERIFGATATLAHSAGAVYCATVVPGCNNTSVHGYENTPKYDGRWGTDVPRFNVAGTAGSAHPADKAFREGKVLWSYDSAWRAAIDSGADWVSIVSWNELHEGTEIEPTREHGLLFLDRTRKWADEFHGKGTSKRRQ